MRPIMSRALCALAMTMGATGPTWGAFSISDAGTAVGGFLNLGVSARADGLGGAYSALGDDWAALAYNPALLSNLQRHSLGALYANQANGIHYGHIAWAGPIRKDGSAGSIGANITYLTYGSLQGTDESGFDTSKFTPQDLAVGLGWSKGFSVGGSGALSPGIGLKFVRMKISDSAAAFAVDLGLLYRHGKIGIAAAVQHLGTSARFISASEKLPTTIRLGLSYKVKSYWTWGLDVIWSRDFAPHLALGSEYTYFFRNSLSDKPGWSLTGRLGVNTESLQGKLAGFQSLRAGFGVGYRSFSLDYALVPLGSLGMTHRISLGYRFGTSPNSQK